MVHLTSYGASATNNGYSPIDILLNGTLILDNYDVAEEHSGSHAFEEDSWQLPIDNLVSGSNTLTIEFEDDPWAETHYWIKSLSVSPGILEIEESDNDNIQLISGIINGTSLNTQNPKIGIGEISVCK